MELSARRALAIYARSDGRRLCIFVFATATCMAIQASIGSLPTWALHVFDARVGDGLQFPDDVRDGKVSGSVIFADWILLLIVRKRPMHRARLHH